MSRLIIPFVFVSPDVENVFFNFIPHSDLKSLLPL